MPLISDFFNNFVNIQNCKDNLYSDLDDGGLENDSDYNEILNAPFTKEEIVKCINKLKNNKSCGQDNITNEFLKDVHRRQKKVLFIENI